MQQTILVVDDDVPLANTLASLLSSAGFTIITAHTAEDGLRQMQQAQPQLAILDIMGVEGYDLLQICNEKRVIGVMLTAYAVTPENIKKSYEDGAASFVPKEEMHNITTFLTDIYEAKEKGKSFWWRWFDRLADYCERKFGPDWQKKHGFKVR